MAKVDDLQRKLQRLSATYMLSAKKRYLQIALNSDLAQARAIINSLPVSERIIIEAGTPLIKEYGHEAIYSLRSWWQTKAQSLIEKESKKPKTVFGLLGKGLRAYARYTNLPIPYFSQQKIGAKREISLNETAFRPYIVADLKCMDRGEREVAIAAQYGASAATCLGHAPIETIDSFIQACEDNEIDAMIDMMNVEFPLLILQKLKKRPRVVVLHRGVDEEKFNPEKKIPYYQIQKIKGTYNEVLIAIAGGDSIREVQRAVFNDCDIVVVWKKFYTSTGKTAALAREFLDEIR